MSHAGVAAATAAGEEAKDDHYLITVNDHGAEFIPQVFETFGIWAPFALSTLFTIADRTTVKCGVSRQLTTASELIIYHLAV